MRDPFEVAAPSVAESQVVIGRCTEIVRVAEITDARLARGVIVADFRRTVGRCVVADDELEILERLREHGADGDFEIGLAVEDRQAQADGGNTSASPGWFVPT